MASSNAAQPTASPSPIARLDRLEARLAHLTRVVYGTIGGVLLLMAASVAGWLYTPDTITAGHLKLHNEAGRQRYLSVDEDGVPFWSWWEVDSQGNPSRFVVVPVVPPGAAAPQNTQRTEVILRDGADPDNPDAADVKILPLPNVTPDSR
jgi:hypothetical protein